MTLEKLIDLKIMDYQADIHDLSVTAIQAEILEKQYKEVETKWLKVTFEIIQHNKADQSRDLLKLVKVF